MWTRPATLPATTNANASSESPEQEIVVDQQYRKQQGQINDRIGKRLARDQVRVVAINLPGVIEENPAQHDSAGKIDQAAHADGERQHGGSEECDRVQQDLQLRELHAMRDRQ